MPCSGKVDHHLIAVGVHDHPVAADGERAEVGGDLQLGLVEPLDRSRPLLVVVDHDDTRRQSKMSGARRLAGEVEVDQEPSTRAVDDEVVPLLESLRLGRGKERGAEEVAAGEHRGHRSHLVYTGSVADVVGLADALSG